MRYVRLGKTNLEGSAIAFGTWAFGGEWGVFDAMEAKEAIHRALDVGITLFDTAQAYGFGESEALLADALWRRVSRDDVVVATKGGLRKQGGELVRDASARWVAGGGRVKPAQPPHGPHRPVPGPLAGPDHAGGRDRRSTRGPCP